MKKRIIIFGNDRGMPGVKIDIEKYDSFFRSSYGGNWTPDEITLLLNPHSSGLLYTISVHRSMELDYLIIVFSGHGGQERETMLEINPQEETIAESFLNNIAKRQLNIFDCCRAYSESLTESVATKLKTKLFSRVDVREKYENRILQAIPQQSRLYACRIGESAYDLGEGGIYSKHLLNCAINMEGKYKYVSDAHDQAGKLTTIEDNRQHPIATLPKCLTKQELILAINPYSP
jgi:hypothetical protein